MRLSYRSEEEIERWRQRDPLDIQGARISSQERAKLDAEAAGILAEAAEFARSSPNPDPAGALDYLYASGLRGRGGTV
jgi:pyruvate dehydrogenase E1 component alpha subunit